MKSSMSSRVGFPSKRASQAEEDVDCPCSPTSSSGPSFHQDTQPSPQSEGAQSASKAPASLAGEEQHGHEDRLSQRMSIPPCTSKEERIALSTAMPHPPVTKETLEELGLAYIQSNISLRIDINYDHDLQFTHDDGIKGEQKQQEARKYWQSLEAELRIMYQHNLYPSCAECNDLGSSNPTESTFFKPRLPEMFLNLKELLTMLIPDGEQGQLVQYLDIPLLLQELRHGLMDIVRLSGWICQLLTSHCAPIRDHDAQDMANHIREGAERCNVHTLVLGIEKLFALLEAMQLDVANHQVRNLRGSFIDDTVAFQQLYFQARISNGVLIVDDSRKWYRNAAASHQKLCHVVGGMSDASTPVALIHGLIGVCFSQNTPIPDTLSHDTSRLRTISAQFLDLVYVDISLWVFDHLLYRLAGPACNPSLIHGVLRMRLMILTDSDAASGLTTPEVWNRHAYAVALELTRAAFQYCQIAESTPPEAEAARTAEQLTAMYHFESQNSARTRAIARALEQTVHDYAKVYQGMTAQAISLTQRRLHLRHATSQVYRYLPDLRDLASRLAHIAVIHWRVWADLAYLVEYEEDEESDDSDSSEDGAESVQQEDGL
ncbi:hypothetical protein A1O3_03321 [Capronia epimyces CBS 606.96]|uniref:Tcp11-domain-containing protein n=1 Tax=Capronia epimyces CBS 606.96 TaxID=1182542 RepID=W9Y9S5_9EURO|nr:uncharacterized protein A1O3_03321 [Capronia epimyces CBS 606.96]EXJ86370.1 hypothetical protein A1O3_03321 [Capronia epimyces CBS 606.96]